MRAGVGAEVAGGVFIAPPNPGERLGLVFPKPVLGLPKPLVLKLLGWSGGLAAERGAEAVPKENPVKGLEAP